MRLFIPGNVPSLKNSKVMTKRGIFHSKTVSKYLQKLGVKSYSAKDYENYVRRPNLFRDAVEPIKRALKDQKPPFVIGFFFIRGTRHRCDWINMVQILADLLVAHKVISDDNMDYLIPYPYMIDRQWYSYSKDKPGVWLDY